MPVSAATTVGGGGLRGGRRAADGGASATPVAARAAAAVTAAVRRRRFKVAPGDGGARRIRTLTRTSGAPPGRMQGRPRKFPIRSRQAQDRDPPVPMSPGRHGARGRRGRRTEPSRTGRSSCSAHRPHVRHLALGAPPTPWRRRLRVTAVPSVTRTVAELHQHGPDLGCSTPPTHSGDVHEVCRARCGSRRPRPRRGRRGPAIPGRVEDVVQLSWPSPPAPTTSVPADVSPRLLLRAPRRGAAAHRRRRPGALARTPRPFELGPRPHRHPRRCTELRAHPHRVRPARRAARAPHPCGAARGAREPGVGSWFGDDHVVEVHLSRLRAKVVRAAAPYIGGVAVRRRLPPRPRHPRRRLTPDVPTEGVP